MSFSFRLGGTNNAKTKMKWTLHILNETCFCSCVHQLSINASWKVGVIIMIQNGTKIPQVTLLIFQGERISLITNWLFGCNMFVERFAFCAANKKSVYKANPTEFVFSFKQTERHAWEKSKLSPRGFLLVFPFCFSPRYVKSLDLYRFVFRKQVKLVRFIVWIIFARF